MKTYRKYIAATVLLSLLFSGIGIHTPSGGVQQAEAAYEYTSVKGTITANDNSIFKKAEVKNIDGTDYLILYSGEFSNSAATFSYNTRGLTMYIMKQQVQDADGDQSTVGHPYINDGTKYNAMCYPDVLVLDHYDDSMKHTEELNASKTKSYDEYKIPLETILDYASNDDNKIPQDAFKGGVTFVFNPVYETKQRPNKDADYTPNGETLYTMDELLAKANWSPGAQDSIKRSYQVKVTIKLTFTTPTPEPKYNFSIKINPADGGTRDGSSEDGKYTADTPLSAVIAPNEGYRFTGWTGDTKKISGFSTTSASQDFLMPGKNVSLTANFAKVPSPTPEPEVTAPPPTGLTPKVTKAPTKAPTPTLSASGGGYKLTIEYNRTAFSSVKGAGTYPAGTVVSIKASIASGYAWKGWTGDGIADTRVASTTVTMPDHDLTITANSDVEEIIPVIIKEENTAYRYYSTSAGFYDGHTDASANEYGKLWHGALDLCMSDYFTMATLSREYYLRGYVNGQPWYYYVNYADEACGVHPAWDASNDTSITFPSSIDGHTVISIGGGHGNYYSGSDHGSNYYNGDRAGDWSYKGSSGVFKFSSSYSYSAGDSTYRTIERCTKEVNAFSGVVGNGKMTYYYSYYDFYKEDTNILRNISERKVDEYHWYNTALTEITIPDTVEWIDAYAFAYCQKLSKINGGKNVKYVEKEAFEGAALTTLLLSEDHYYNGSNSTTVNATQLAWQSHAQLSDKFAFPQPDQWENLCILDDNAFAYHSNLDNVRLGSTVDYIHEDVFAYDRLPEIWIENKDVRYIDGSRFTLGSGEESQYSEIGAVTRQIARMDRLISMFGAAQTSGQYYVNVQDGREDGDYGPYRLPKQTGSSTYTLTSLENKHSEKIGDSYVVFFRIYSSDFEAYRGGCALYKVELQNRLASLQSATDPRTIVRSEGGGSVEAYVNANIGYYRMLPPGNKHTFDKQGGSGGSDYVCVLNGETMPNITVPSKSGFQFAGYFTGPNCTGYMIYKENGVPEITKCVHDSDTTLYAGWVKTVFTVTLLPNGTTEFPAYVSPTSITVTYGGTYATLPTPTRTGYDFDGWFLEETIGGVTYATKINPTDTVRITNDVTLKAYWTPKIYTLPLNPNGGTAVLPSVQVSTADTANNKIISGIRRAGYAFLGWYTAASDGEQVYDNAEKCLAGTYWSAAWSTGYWKYDGAITMYAHWTPNDYTVMFDKRGGSGGTDSVTATYDSMFPDITPPARRGHDFDGYYTKPGGTGTRYADKDGKGIKAWDIPEDTVLYAKWDAWKYTVRIYGDDSRILGQTPGSVTELAYGGSIAVGEMSDRSYTVAYDLNKPGSTTPSFMAPLTVANTKASLAFQGWNLYAYVPNGTGYKKEFVTLLAKNDTYRLPDIRGVGKDPYPSGTIFEIYPYWDADESALIELPAAQCTGYDFVGWASGDVIVYYVGGTCGTYRPQFENETMKAVWAAKQYYVTYDPCITEEYPGVVNPPGKEVTFDQPYGIPCFGQPYGKLPSQPPYGTVDPTPPYVNRPGFTFDGWFDTPQEGTWEIKK